jgi:hypothetical protein
LLESVAKALAFSVPPLKETPASVNIKEQTVHSIVRMIQEKKPVPKELMNAPFLLKKMSTSKKPSDLFGYLCHQLNEELKHSSFDLGSIRWNTNEFLSTVPLSLSWVKSVEQLFEDLPFKDLDKQIFIALSSGSQEDTDRVDNSIILYVSNRRYVLPIDTFTIPATVSAGRKYVLTGVVVGQNFENTKKYFAQHFKGQSKPEKIESAESHTISYGTYYNVTYNSNHRPLLIIYTEES